MLGQLKLNNQVLLFHDPPSLYREKDTKITQLMFLKAQDLPNEFPFFICCSGPTIASQSLGNLEGNELPKCSANLTRANSEPLLWILRTLAV